ncbi:MAG TPA: trehalose-phosphatase [Rhodanobacteraceae bacterium]|nr:trehalose-phosphatase [Rhodanobacteraceae bacterium]
MSLVESNAAASHRLPAPPRADPASLALFVDIDGTLLDIAARPDAVVVDVSLREMLLALHARLGGALALLSGRSLEDIDGLLDLRELAAAGLHGAELRAAGGGLLATAQDAPLYAARRRAAEIAQAIPGVLVEDKGAAIALHYRAVPDAELDVRRAAIGLLDLAGPDYDLLQGRCVIELKPHHADKGSALATLIGTRPFAGRTPWMIGDDLTDEHAFAEADALGGAGIVVGARRPTVARYALAGPADARAWMRSLIP